MTVPRPQDGGLDARQAGSFADLALANIAQAYPHKLDHVLGGDADVVVPRVLHPAFHGSYDWHSCVHMHWLLVHLVSAFPELPQRGAVEAQLDASLAPEPIAAECMYLARPHAGAFERTYGWAWLLKLATELAGSSHPHAQRWSECLAPLAEAIVARYLAYLPKADYPIRHGMHANSAFGLLFAVEHARATGTDDLAALCIGKSRAWFMADVDAPIGWEPSGADFLSPILMEAALMAAVVGTRAFPSWLDRYLPGLSTDAARLQPVRVSDRADAQIVHLDGLNLSRAWCLRLIAGGLPGGDVRQEILATSARDHFSAGLAGLDGDAFVATHWLTSFAALAAAAAHPAAKPEGTGARGELPRC